MHTLTSQDYSLFCTSVYRSDPFLKEESLGKQIIHRKI